MRRSAALESIWNSGLFISNNRANAYVTVNPSWHLAKDSSSSASVYEPERMPFRRWADTGADIDVPRSIVKRIDITRSITEDCGQLNLTIKNAAAGGGPDIDSQGYFSLRQGEGDASWGKTGSDWGKITLPGESVSYGHFGPGSMVKTYQGYGGYNLGLGAALGAGYVVPTGVWIIDDTNISANGDLVVIARDLGSLLIDQTLYPKFMPDACYPLQFYSKTWNEEVNGDPDGFVPTETNYDDLINIAELMALWAGFHAPDGSGVLGHVEETGIDSPAPFKAEFFDKKQPIDVIKEVLKIVGYRAWVDQEGGLRMTSQNIWQAGNRLYDGSQTGTCFAIHERHVLTGFTGSWTRRSDRSHIIVSQGNPAIEDGVKHATWDTTETGDASGPPEQRRVQLRGATYPAFWQLDKDIPIGDMIMMAELTGIRMFFARHGGRITAWANPLIDPDDQVKLVEATSWDHFLHRVQSMSTTYDAETGEYTMDLTTNWMGPIDSGWYIEITDDGHVRYNQMANP